VLQKPYYYLADNEMAQLKEVFAQNLKKIRRKCGLTQAQLSEKVNVSTHHIAMIEIARNSPTMELVERIAQVLGIEFFELFTESHTPKSAMERLHDTLVENIQEVVNETVRQAIAENIGNGKEGKIKSGKSLKTKK
jgi:transcriptional regulator with XRE-family HTH domain